MITIGTDCSGIEAPIEALKQLGIPFQHKWCCEIDKFARQSIRANYEPEILYEDITTRDHSQLPDVDIYVCGFPCQSFSLMGKKLGTRDPRSNIMMHCIDVIKKKRPPVFILENVKNFKFIEKGQPYSYLLNELSSIIDEDGEQVYNVYPDIYNTKDYGIPQNRERIYIIGIQRDIELQNYKTPQPLPMRPLDDFIVDKTIHKRVINNKSLQNNLEKIKYHVGNVILSINYFFPLKGIVPTLTTQCSKTFHTTYNRKLSVRECLSLQGFSSSFNQVVSDHQFYKQIGNSMSVNVLKSIYLEVFDSTVLKHIL
jgi:DNA (cytosine-5)-methyltransferase 1